RALRLAAVTGEPGQEGGGGTLYHVQAVGVHALPPGLQAHRADASDHGARRSRQRAHRRRDPLPGLVPSWPPSPGPLLMHRALGLLLALAAVVAWPHPAPAADRIRVVAT